MQERNGRDGAGEPMFNLPPVILSLIGVLAAIHFGRTYLLDPDTDGRFLILFSFIPARFDALAQGMPVPGGYFAAIWSFVTYAFLHADFVHLGVNSLWMVAFGGALARRFGTARFLLFSAACAAAGALAHLAFFQDGIVPVIGASAAVSGHMAASCRFAFATGRSGIGLRRGPYELSDRMPALTLRQAFTDRRVLFFIGLWFGINLLAGIGALAMPGEEGIAVAWQAHVGGFVAGMLLFSIFDPVGTHPADEWE